jgi:hypothetical protein
VYTYEFSAWNILYFALLTLLKNKHEFTGTGTTYGIFGKFAKLKLDQLEKIMNFQDCIRK